MGYGLLLGKTWGEENDDDEEGQMVGFYALRRCT